VVSKLALEQTPNELLGDLKRLGFTDYEAKIYLQLLRHSPSTAYEIAKSAGVPRPNTYQALENLAQRGAALPVSESPVRYIAAAPEVFFATIARQTNALCTDVVERVAKFALVANDHYVWTLRGEMSVHDKIGVLISQSCKAVWVKAADDVLRQHKPALKAAAARGVEILIVLFGQDASEFVFSDTCRVYIHEGSGVRMGSADNLFTIAVDHKEMLTAAMDGEVTAAHTQSHPIVNMAQSLIRHDYYMAEIFAKFGSEIEASFGPHLQKLRMASFSQTEIESFKEKTGLK
tara:strand:+ start:48220 stop:49089 length:870 start_codon:yes stop_codon:yes gene_type:complete